MAALIELISIAIDIYILLIFIYVIMSYFPEARGSKFNYYLTRICEPLISRFRFATISGISLAPMAASFFLIIIREILFYLY